MPHGLQKLSMLFTTADIKYDLVEGESDVLLISMQLEVEGEAIPNTALGLVFPLKYTHPDGTIYTRIPELPVVADVQVQTSRNPVCSYPALCHMIDDEKIQLAIEPQHITKPTRVTFSGILRWGAQIGDSAKRLQPTTQRAKRKMAKQLERFGSKKSCN